MGINFYEERYQQQRHYLLILGPEARRDVLDSAIGVMTSLRHIRRMNMELLKIRIKAKDSLVEVAKPLLNKYSDMGINLYRVLFPLIDIENYNHCSKP